MWFPRLLAFLGFFFFSFSHLAVWSRAEHRTTPPQQCSDKTLISLRRGRHLGQRQQAEARQHLPKHQPLGARGHRPSERHRFPCGTISVTQSLCRRRGLHEKPSVQAPARRTTTRHTHAPESVRAFAQHRRRTLTPQPYCCGVWLFSRSC